MPVKRGDRVRTTRPLVDRQAYYLDRGKQGTTIVSIPAGAILVAATDELGGNVFVETKDASGEAVLVPLAEGEWETS